MDNLPISVVVATKNSGKTIEQCLESVRINNPAEIIVVDGLSNDRTLDIARKYTSRIFSDEGNGFNYAQQLGVEKAANKYIAFVDSDIILPEGTLAKLLDDLIRTNCIKIAASILPVGLNSYWERVTAWNVNLLRKRRKVGGFQATILLRDVLLKYKLDSSVGCGSDLDFNIRIERAGLKQGVSSAFAYHHHRSKFMDFFRQRFRFGFESTRFIAKYGPFHARFWPPLIVTYWVGVCIIKGKPQYIPYFIVDGCAESLGMIKGFIKLINESDKK